jgi:hypothetical protein
MDMRASLTTIFFALGIALLAAMPSPTLAQSRGNVLEGLPQGLSSRPGVAKRRGVNVQLPEYSKTNDNKKKDK